MIRLPGTQADATLGFPRLGAGLAVATLVALVAVDVALEPDIALISAFAIPPFIAALLAGTRVTAAIGGLAIAAAIANGLSNGLFDEAQYLVRLAVLIAAACFAVFGAWVRSRALAAMRRMAMLNAVGEFADGSLDLDETLRRVTEVIVPAAADLCMIDTVRDGRPVRVAVRAHGRADTTRIEDGIRSREPSIPGRLLNVDQPFPEPYLVAEMNDETFRGLAHDPADLELLRSLSTGSYVNVPLMARGRSLGVLTLVVAWSGRRYGEGDARFAQTLGGRVALALDNAGLFSDLESVERRMDNVMAIIDEAVVIQDEGGELVYANAAAAARMGFASPAEATAIPVARIRERFLLRTEAGEAMPPDQFVGRRALAGEQPEAQVMRVTDLETGDERWELARANAVEGPDGRAIYAVSVIDDITAVKRSELAQALLARTGELLASSTDYRRVLGEIAQLAVPDFADYSAVNLPLPDGTIDQVALAHTDPEKLAYARELSERYPNSMDDEAGVAAVIRTGEAQLVDMPDELLAAVAHDEEHLRLLRAVGVRSAIIVPMLAGAKVVGALGFVNAQGSRRFDQVDLEIAAELGRRAGIAVEHARLAGERAEIATVLQRGLLPPELPVTPGFEIATMYRPAGEVNEVGGDFYDAFEVEDGWMLVVGDVVGRGAAAASLTALARYTLRTAGMLTGDPRVALRQLNGALRSRPQLALCTAAIVVLPREQSDAIALHLAIAGHPLPLRLREGRIEEIGTHGALLGAFDDPEWRVSSVDLRAGDQIVVYTDGVVEARGRSERFGEARLRAVLAGAGNATGAIERIEAGLDEFVPGDLQDDAAALALRRVGSGCSGHFDRDYAAATRAGA